MIYIVSGYMRTGTSMMMNALSAGGLEPLFNPQRDNMNDRWGDSGYKPNPVGFYELQRQEYRQRGFPGMYEGRLIKLLYGGLPRLAALDSGYRYVFMRRDTEEIRQSYEAFFGAKIARSMQEVMNHYDEIMDDAVKGLHNRKDTVSVHEFWYREVVTHPIEHFQILRDAGWPIEVSKAAMTVDTSQCRFKREILTEGI